MNWNDVKTIVSNLFSGKESIHKFNDHYNFNGWDGTTRCFLCDKQVHYERDFSDKGWNIDHVECHVCRTPVCAECAEIFIEHEWDHLGMYYCHRYKLCKLCQENHPKIEHVNDLLRLKPQGHGCFVCGKREVESRRSVAANPLNIKPCARCEIAACPDCARKVGCQFLCLKCAEEVEANKVTCPICNKTIYREQQAIIKCPCCEREFCLEHKVVRRVDYKIRNVCPDCVSKTQPLEK